MNPKTNIKHGQVTRSVYIRNEMSALENANWEFSETSGNSSIQNQNQKVVSVKLFVEIF